MGPIKFSYASKLWGSATHTTAGVMHLFFYPSAPGPYEYLLSESFAEEYAETSKLGVTHLYVTNLVPTLGCDTGKGCQEGSSRCRQLSGGTGA